MSKILVTAVICYALIQGCRLWLQLYFKPENNTLPWNPQNFEQPYPSIPVPAIILVIGFLGLLVLPSLFLASEKDFRFTPEEVMSSCAISMMIWLMAFTFLTLIPNRSEKEYGITFDKFESQMQWGVAGYFLALPPTALIMVLSMFWRTSEDAHPYLQSLIENPDPQLISSIAISAVFVAPLCEEMIFRVIIQSWLIQQTSYWQGVTITALVFALVHGIDDAILLMPLSFVLGILYAQTRSYYAVLITHGLFNAINLSGLFVI